MKRLLLTSFILSLSLITYAQEVCNDGIDNDGDGFIDCFDSDCSESSNCDGFYIGNDASCEAIPNEFPAFALKLDFASPNQTTNHLGRIAIGDLDRDGIPEIVTQNKFTNKVHLLNGDDGSIKRSQTVNRPDYRMAIANVEDDDCGEVFVIEMSDNENERYVKALDCELNILWTSENLGYNSDKGTGNDPTHLSLADFDRDGRVELYYKNEIRDALTGLRLVDGDNDDWADFIAGGVAVDILGDEDLELVTGDKIYSVNLGSRTQDAGTLTEIESIPVNFEVKKLYFSVSTTSVADYNQDGFLDIIVTGADDNQVTTVYFWDVHNNNVITYSDPIAFLSGYEKGWKRGTGRLNIGDLDGDGELNVSFVSGRYLYALDENFELFWRVQIKEETSGHTGCTLFDFNGDGQMEVVYRDEGNLYIINGNDGTVFTSQTCISRTYVEYPIVADVDADGETEICIVCGTDNQNSADNFDDINYSTNSQVRVFESDLEPWVPARRVWNQHAYFNVNVNDDLSIPRVQQKHHLIWSEGSCTQGPNRPLNGFLNQSPFLSSDGCPVYAAPDLAIVEGSMVVEQPDCPDTDFTVSFDYTNLGDVKISGDVPVSFYAGDPLVAGSTRLFTTILTLNQFATGAVASVINLPITGPGSAFTLFAVLNDDGSSVPTPIELPNTNFIECEYDNNIASVDVIPNPFPLQTETTDNIACVGSSTPANGSARAFRLVGGSELTADYDFHWFNGVTVTPTEDYLGAIYSGLASGTYTVFATHKTAMCNSDTVQVVINDASTTIAAEIELVQANSNCNNYNGTLKVEVNGGDPVGNFNYEWYVGSTVGGGLLISNSHTASGLAPSVYTVLVTDKTTNCTTIESSEVPDLSETPVVTASAENIICSDANSGSVSATVNGETAGYVFRWYIGANQKPSADYTGSTVNSLPAGDYTVVARNTATKCNSQPETVTISQTTAPEITSTGSTDMSSCDSSDPNGSVTVNFTGDAADFSITWYEGANTSNPSIGSTQTLDNLPAGVYTVVLTDIVTGCNDTDQATVINDVIIPSTSLDATPVTTCSPFNGTVTASVSFGGVSDYTFQWFDGISVKATPDYTETSNVLSGLAPGFYTVSAFHNTRNCLANQQTIEVIDNAQINITQSSAIITRPSECDSDDGELEVTANSPNNTSGFTFEWYAGASVSGTPFFTETGVSISRATNLSTGLYTVVATDLDNGCSNFAVFDLPFVDAHELELISETNATTCNPSNDGAIEFSLTPTPLAGFDESNYELRIYQGTDTSVPHINSTPGISGTSDYTFAGLTPDQYVIEAIADQALGGCSVYILAEVGLDATDPVISQVQSMGNISCTTPTATGLIEVSVDNNATLTDYTFTWYEGNSTAANVLGTTTGSVGGTNGEVASNLIAGAYTVEVLNIATQCSSVATYSIADNPMVVSITAADINVSPVSTCISSNGEATVVAIQENGIVANLADYTFEWYDQNNNILPNAATPNTSNTISALAAGNYYVTATNNITECSTTLNEFVIDDITLNDPFVELVDFQNPSRCKLDEFGADGNDIGFLEIEPMGTSTSGFGIEWREDSETGNVIASAANSTRLDNITFTSDTKSYFVTVTNLDTQCEKTEEYIMELVVEPVNITASSSPITNCLMPDGSVYATVTSNGSNSYDYTWTFEDGTIAGTGKNLVDLSALGVYTVLATSQLDNFCTTTTSVSVTEDRISPNIAIEMVNPLTVCDLSNADGAASATVDGGFVGYTFEWFEGNTTTGSVIFTGPEISGLLASTYTVRATNNVSQCSSEQSITITEEIDLMPDPTIEVISHDTHCVIDNGILAVSVNGNTSNYIFNWYIGESVKANPDFVGEIFKDLAAGLYTVTATDLTTGCISNPVTGEILEILEFPAMKFDQGNATCSNDDGFVLLTLTNNVEVASITWTDENGFEVAVGPNLTEASAGNYHVFIETSMGCTAEADVSIETDINPYNGISRNGDGSNDFFNIDCIESFPNNIVKIFNRSGTLVYEIEGYVNQDASKRFDGVSNKGLSPIGTGLPDGTYFYVIDKKDGTKPFSGYLEIVN